jgi:hypothetical protein
MYNYKVSALLEYPIIQAKITELWGTSECAVYIADLVYPDSLYTQSLPADLVTELQAVLEYHQCRYGVSG